jgi:hypothetical protein
LASLELRAGADEGDHNKSLHSAEIDVKQVSTFAGHTPVSFTLETYGHLHPPSGENFIRKLNGVSAVPRSNGSGHGDGEDLAEIVAIRPGLEKDGGASKNRTYDLSIISAAL